MIEFRLHQRHERRGGLAVLAVAACDQAPEAPVMLRGGEAFIARTRPLIFGEFEAYWLTTFGATFQYSGTHAATPGIFSTRVVTVPALR